MKHIPPIIAIGAFLALIAWPPAVYALPQGETVTAGAASFSQTPTDMTIRQTTDKLVTDWSSFSIAAPETVRFIQPGAASVALNRVRGTDPSSIFGTLNANGQVFLVNPNGILFGASARVSTSGLIASTLDINNTQFLNGNYYFGGKQFQGYYFYNPGRGTVTNNGVINTPNGSTFLLGSAVANDGVIMARTAGLASGRQVGVVMNSAGNVAPLTIHSGLLGNPAGRANAITNSGTIAAGKVILTQNAVSDIFQNAVNHSGVVEADTIMINGNSRILLTKKLSATREIDISGPKVEINSALVEAKTTGGRPASVKITSTGDITVNNSTVETLVTTSPTEGSASANVELFGAKTVLIKDSRISSNVISTVANPNFVNNTRLVIRSASNAAGDVNVTLDHSQIDSRASGSASFAEHVIEAVHNATANTYHLPYGSSLVTIKNGTNITVLQSGIGSEKITIRARDKSPNLDTGSSRVFIAGGSNVTAYSDMNLATIALESINDVYTPITGGQVVAPIGTIKIGESSSLDAISPSGSLISLDSGINIDLSGSTLRTNALRNDVGVVDIESRRGDINLSRVLSKEINVNAPIGGISGGLLLGGNALLLAGAQIGTAGSPVSMDLLSVSAESEKGDINFTGLGNTTLGDSNGSVIARNGNVKVRSRGDLTVRGVEAWNGGVSLVSANGSIFAGTQTGPYGTHIIAEGKSFLSAPRGTIGVGTPAGKPTGIVGQIEGVVRTLNGGLARPAVNNTGTPTGVVYYRDADDIFDAPVNVSPAPINGVARAIYPSWNNSTLTAMNHPLAVSVIQRPGAASALPAGITSNSTLTLRTVSQN